MPNSIIKSYANKYDVSEKEVEKIWKESEKIVADQYGELKDKSWKKTKNKFYGTLVKIFKNKIKKRYSNNEHLSFTLKRFDDFNF